MAATLSVVMALLQSGDHIICSQDVFGSTRVMLNNYIIKFGVEVTYVALTDLERMAAGNSAQHKDAVLRDPIQSDV